MCGHFPVVVFYEYMNIFNGHLSQGRFPAVDKFPCEKTDARRPCSSLFLFFYLYFIPLPYPIRGKEYDGTVAFVFDYGYFETKFIFWPPKA